MGRVTFQDPEVIQRVERDFCATWKNVHPGYRVEHLEGARFEEVKRIPNGQASENVVTLFCTPDGELLHVVPEQWKRAARDLTPVARVMSEVEPLLRQGRFPEAERVLDHGLRLLNEPRKD